MIFKHSEQPKSFPELIMPKSFPKLIIFNTVIIFHCLLECSSQISSEPDNTCLSQLVNVVHTPPFPNFPVSMSTTIILLITSTWKFEHFTLFHSQLSLFVITYARFWVCNISWMPFHLCRFSILNLTEATIPTDCTLTILILYQFWIHTPPDFSMSLLPMIQDSNSSA